MNQSSQRDRKVPIICNESCWCNEESDMKIKRCSHYGKYISGSINSMQDTDVHIPCEKISHTQNTSLTSKGGMTS